jgi:small-conductance mechanosensitive channel
MAKSKINELKELEKLANKIARKKQRIEAQLQDQLEAAKWYDQVLKESDFKRPRDLIKALMAHFGIRTVSLSGAKRGPGRPPKAAAANTAGKAKAATASRRKRTKVTADLRDKVKASLEKGTSRNATATSMGVSNLVVKKIAAGAYDKL